ncbi:MAG TPA: hypothetical protein VHX68_20820, partial [Planctomycetaceae bacterium]|nr:hypothetical protein [Planctomycetaceae bacterium]
MPRRQKILAILLVCVVAGWWGLPILRRMVLGRLDDDVRRIQSLKSAAAALEDKEFQVQINQRRMNEWLDRSLPPEPVEAQRLYQEWLNDLAEVAGISNLRVTPEPLQVNLNASFRTVRVSVKGNSTFEQLTYFLHEFYRVDLLHRVQSLKVESPANPGEPLKIVVTAEGLCLHDAAPRKYLFPRTELANSLPRSFDTVKVASTEGFPSAPEFMIRIEGTPTEPSELVTVTKIAGNKWTVKRAAEGSTKVYHPPKAEVELFPVRYEQRAVSLDERRKGLVKHPFVQPIPPRVLVADGDDPARQTKLIMTSLEDKEHVAWLLNAVTRQNTVVKKGTTVSVGDVNGTVVAIESDSIQIKRGTELWQLALGRDLRSMTRVESGSGDDSAFSGYSD